MATHLDLATSRGLSRPLHELQSAMDLDSFWRANLKLLQAVLPHHSCSLLLGIVDLEPREGRHFVAQGSDGHNQPVTSLSIASPFLANHPLVKMYTGASSACVANSWAPGPGTARCSIRRPAGSIMSPPPALVCSKPPSIKRMRPPR